MRRLRRLPVLTFLVFTLITLLLVVPVGAEEDLSGQVNGLKDEIDELEGKINQSRQKQQTLSSQITAMNQRIELAQLKIDQTTIEINSLKEEIVDLSVKIGKLDVSLDKISHVLLHRVIETYKSDRADNFLALLSEEGAGGLVRNSRYLKQAQKHDKMLMVAVEEAKQNYDAQKDLKEEKQAKLKSLKTQLEEQNNQLEQQKQEKAYLLKVTRNDEERYQQMLAEARAELAEIQQAALLLKSTGEAVSVARGELIGIQGNTGYSTGDHLHFAVYNYASIDALGDDWYYHNYDNPLNYLSGQSVAWQSGCGADGTKAVGGGGWPWPMKNIKYISQGYGYTCHSNALYGGRPHPAIDLVGPVNTQIFAVDEGKAYFCRNCLGDGGNGVFIFHPNGKMTMYWHVK